MKKIAITNNQYSNKVYLDPKIEQKAILIECGSDEFFGYYFDIIELPHRYRKLYLTILGQCDNAGGFYTRNYRGLSAAEFRDLFGYSKDSVKVLLSELTKIKFHSTPYIKKVSNGAYKIPETFFYRKQFKEIKITVTNYNEIIKA